MIKQNINNDLNKINIEYIESVKKENEQHKKRLIDLNIKYTKKKENLIKRYNSKSFN